MKRSTAGLIGLSWLLIGTAGCAHFWDEVTSHECDWAYATGIGKPDPLTVLKTHGDRIAGADGARRAQALASLHEPLQHGGTAKDQQLYLDILYAAVTTDSEPTCRLSAVRALGKYKDPRAARMLEEVYQLPARKPQGVDDKVLYFTHDINCMIRKESIEGLEKSADPEARHLLIRVARQPGPPPTADIADRLQTQDEKLVAIRALGKYKQAECVEALQYVLRSEKDVALRGRAVESLEQATGKRWPSTLEAWQRDDVHPLPGEPGTGVIERVGAWIPKF